MFNFNHTVKDVEPDVIEEISGKCKKWLKKKVLTSGLSHSDFMARWGKGQRKNLVRHDQASTYSIIDECTHGEGTVDDYGHSFYVHGTVAHHQNSDNELALFKHITELSSHYVGKTGNYHTHIVAHQCSFSHLPKTIHDSVVFVSYPEDVLHELINASLVDILHKHGTFFNDDDINSHLNHLLSNHVLYTVYHVDSKQMFTITPKINKDILNHIGDNDKTVHNYAAPPPSSSLLFGAYTDAKMSNDDESLGHKNVRHNGLGHYYYKRIPPHSHEKRKLLMTNLFDNGTAQPLFGCISKFENGNSKFDYFHNYVKAMYVNLTGDTDTIDKLNDYIEGLRKYQSNTSPFNSGLTNVQDTPLQSVFWKHCFQDLVVWPVIKGADNQELMDIKASIKQELQAASKKHGIPYELFTDYAADSVMSLYDMIHAGRHFIYDLLEDHQAMRLWITSVEFNDHKTVVNSFTGKQGQVNVGKSLVLNKSISDEELTNCIRRILRVYYMDMTYFKNVIEPMINDRKSLKKYLLEKIHVSN